jgi:hypothetical protein
VAVKSRRTRSSWDGGPAFLPFLLPFLPNTDYQPLSAQTRHMVRSPRWWPA